MNWGNLDFTPLWITMKTGVAATFVSFFLGIFAARFVMSRKGKARAFWDGFLTMPLVLPPTVAGYILLRTFSTRRSFGHFLANSLGIQAVHTWLGCVLAATVIAFPLMYRNARAAFEQVDENVIYAAQTLGLSERTIFWRPIRTVKAIEFHIKVQVFHALPPNPIFTICIFIPLSPTLARNRKKQLTDGSFKSL